MIIEKLNEIDKSISEMLSVRNDYDHMQDCCDDIVNGIDGIRQQLEKITNILTRLMYASIRSCDLNEGAKVCDIFDLILKGETNA